MPGSRCLDAGGSGGFTLISDRGIGPRSTVFDNLDG